MKKQQKDELKAKTPAQLKSLVAENRKKLHALQLDFLAGKVKNVRTITEVKKEIARALTYLAQQAA